MKVFRPAALRRGSIMLTFMRRAHTNAKLALPMDQFRAHDQLPGLFSCHNALSPSVFSALKKAFDRTFELADRERSANRFSTTFHDKTGKQADEINIQDPDDPTQSESTLNASYFNTYHRESEAIHGKHTALTFPQQLPIFIKPLVAATTLRTHKPHYLFMNCYELPANAPADETVFDWHIDLKRFGEISVIFNVSGSGLLQFVQIHPDDLKKNSDGYQQPRLERIDAELKEIELKPNDLVILSGAARYEYAHRVVMHPHSTRRSVALGMVKQ